MVQFYSTAWIGLKADAKSKVIECYAVTDASVHDSQKLAELVEAAEGEVYADPDTECRGAEAEAMLAQKQPQNLLVECASTPTAL